MNDVKTNLIPRNQALFVMKLTESQLKTFKYRLNLRELIKSHKNFGQTKNNPQSIHPLVKQI
jgi:hypothetical protein